jgi:hypothetical protein
VYSHEQIADRMRWVIDSGRVKNASVWAMAAGMSRTFVSGFLERAQKGKWQDIGLHSLARLAEAAHVSLAWLALGIGEPEDEVASWLPENLRTFTQDKSSPYPAALLRQAVLVTAMVGEKDLPKEIWRDYLDGLRKEVRRIGLELAASRLEERGFKR